MTQSLLATYIEGEKKHRQLKATQESLKER